MAIALLVTLVGVTLSPLLLTMVVREVDSTRRIDARVQAINAAQAGLGVALGEIRAASDAYGGNRAKLPCTTLRGTVDPDAEGEGARYEVAIDYFNTDPSGHHDDLSAIEGNRVACTSAGPVTVPAFALLRAKGTGSSGGTSGSAPDPDAGTWRSIYATYTLYTSAEDIPGGIIRIAESPGRLCLGATSATASADNYLIARPCNDASALTTWLYTKNLTLILASSRTPTRPGGLCVHANSQAEGEVVKLTPCAATTEFQQQWRFSAEHFTYQGTADGATDSGFCLNMQIPDMANSQVVLRTGPGRCGGNPFSSSRNFFPDPEVGSGGSGVNTGQLVNRGEIGRCLDLPRDDVTGKIYTKDGREPALVTYPCKQSFSAAVHWNHKWALPPMPVDDYWAAGPISITPAEPSDPGYGADYCLTSPGVVPGRVWVAACESQNPAQQWTRTQRAPLMEDSYRIRDSYGNCLQSVGPSANYAFKLDAWSQVVTRPCDGSDLQQWNVPPTVSAGPLKDLGEQ